MKSVRYDILTKQRIISNALRVPFISLSAETKLWSIISRSSGVTTIYLDVGYQMLKSIRLEGLERQKRQGDGYGWTRDQVVV